MIPAKEMVSMGMLPEIEEKIKGVLRQTIEKTVRRAQDSFGSDPCVGGLLKFSLDDRVTTDNYHHAIGDIDHAQEMVFKVMAEFGFDPNMFEQEKPAVQVGLDNVSIMTSKFPSQTMEGLCFQRITYYVKENNRPCHVEWHVLAAPSLNNEARPLGSPQSPHKI